MASVLLRWTSTFVILAIAAFDVRAQNYTAVPRWGQASAIIYNTLFVFGGKTDPQHQFTYTSAPNTNDLLSLDLSSEFSLSSPPWTYLAGSQNTSSSQGPAVAFHTLTPYTTSDLLLFGGDAGFDAIETNADSAWLLDAYDLTAPSWSSQTNGWASEPIRRLYHAAPSASGAVYIIDGEKGDGSQIGFPDSYLFDAVADNGSPAFIPLTSVANAPTGLYGHAAHVLPGGILLVFGGFFTSLNTPSPLSTIYTLNTTSSSPTWAIQNATGMIPSSRRGFASVQLDDGKILIHGGADAALQTLFSDGALLDTTQNPMSWSPVDVLSGTLGPRVGHLAALIHGTVLFCFGWAGNAPASANLELYDPTSSTFQPTYTPPPTPISITTLPVSPTAPGGTYPTSGANTGQGSPGVPTKTGDGSFPTHTTGGGNGHNDDKPETKSNPAAIVVGSVIGFLAFVGLVGGGVYYALRRRERRAWMGVNANVKKDIEGRWKLIPVEEWNVQTEDSPMNTENNVQMAGTGWHSQPRHGWRLLDLGALFGIAGAYGKHGRRRFDMLADEDARQFDADSVFHEEETTPWRYENTKIRPGTRRQGTGGSSISSGLPAGRSVWGNVWNASMTSLKNVSVTLGVSATGAAAAREGNGHNVNPPQWWEKDELPLDPFADPTTDPLIGSDAPMRPRGGNYAAYSRTSNPYVDPFEDPSEGAAGAKGTASLLGDHDEGTTSTLGGEPVNSSQNSLPRSIALSGVARASAGSPSSSERGGGGASVASHDASSSRTTQSNSNTGTGLASSSNDHSSGISSPISPRTTSIIGAITAPITPMRRSDSWWSRFSRTPLRDRRSFNDASRPRSAGDGGLTEFRDPNPAPRLGPIAESTHTSPQATQDDSGGGTAKSTKQKSGSGYAVSTKSSIKTADSELIERMDGRMVVVQRALSLASRGSASPTTTLESPEDAPRKPDQLSMDASSDHSHRRSWTTISGTETESFIAESPIEDSTEDPSVSSHNPLGPSTSTQTNAPHLAGPRPLRRTPTGAVAARVSAYERRMSQDVVAHDGPRSPPADTKLRQEEQHRRGKVGYELAPKAPLFVANPDRRGASGSSS